MILKRKYKYAGVKDFKKFEVPRVGRDLTCQVASRNALHDLTGFKIKIFTSLAHHIFFLFEMNSKLLQFLQNRFVDLFVCWKMNSC